MAGGLFQRNRDMAKKKTPEKYVCIKACFYDNRKYKHGDSVTVVGDMPNKNFQLASIPVIPPAKEAVTALSKTLRHQLRDYHALNGLNLDEELEKRGINSLAAWPIEDAVELIAELRERYEESQRKGPEVGADVKASEDEAGEAVEK